MFLDDDIRGALLPDHALCLTFDDGPGRDTTALGAFLLEQRIEAAFFSLGMHISRPPEVVQVLRAQRHTVGNHTYSHPGLVALMNSGGDVIGEVARTNELLGPSALHLLRPPYGSWRREHNDNVSGRSAVARALNSAPCSRNTVGPIKWDISAADFDCWLREDRPERCAQGYLDAIESKHSGIVLFHDSSSDPELAEKNRTFELIRSLIPQLITRNYRFVGINQVPAIKSAAAVRRLTGFEVLDGRMLRTDDRGAVSAEMTRSPEQFGIVPCADGGFHIRARSGCYLDAKGGALAASALESGESTCFRLEGSEDRYFTLRAANGAYVDSNFSARGRRGAAILFSFTDLIEEL